MDRRDGLRADSHSDVLADPVPDEHEVRRLETIFEQQARSVGHCLTHKPKLPYCHICAHAKMKEKAHKRGAFHKELKAWGDLLTADHMDTKSRDALGLHGQPEAFTIISMVTNEAYLSGTEQDSCHNCTLHSRLHRRSEGEFTSCRLCGRNWESLSNGGYPTGRISTGDASNQIFD